ncbi:DUF4176 domain-containing protein [Mollicutes bacterium LVI A0078]|nr:DUF4176 domain-containing protein [Mollicutes bacterium LVI A0075]WOO91725.1 DUF4176 domain-containing protein [Mollicutes bacterium LVI A0078]
MKNLYPIGTVIKVKGLKQNIMICGLYMEMVDGSKVFDYAAIDFPIGYSPDGNLHVFNNEHIEEVLHMGWPNEEHCVYVENLMLFNKEDEYKNTDFDVEGQLKELENEEEVLEEDEYTQF